MKKVKKISKYVVNSLGMINALIVGLSPIWGWKLDKVTDSIIVISGVISAYLIVGKLFKNNEKEVVGKGEE